MQPAPAPEAPRAHLRHSHMDPSQFKVFRDITLDYFSKLAPEQEAPSVAEAFMQFESALFLDYASLVNIHGEFSGCLYVTTPRAVIERLLQLHGEPEISERTRLDMCRELSNVLSGNASHAFGSTWHISVPRSLEAADMPSLKMPASSYVLPVRWLDATSYIVVGLESRATIPGQ